MSYFYDHITQPFLYSKVHFLSKTKVKTLMDPWTL